MAFNFGSAEKVEETTPAPAGGGFNFASAKPLPSHQTQQEPKRVGDYWDTLVSGGDKTGEQLKQRYLQATGPELEQSIGQSQDVLQATAGGVGKQLVYDTPQWTAELFGAADLANAYKRGGDNLEAAMRDLNLPKQPQAVGEAIGGGIGLGAASLPLGVLSKTFQLTKKLSEGNTFTKSVAKLLEQGRTAPLEVMGAEAAIAGTGALAGQGVGGATDSPFLGVVAEILTSIRVAPKLYSEVSDVWNLSRASYVEQEMAKNLRAKYSPEQLAAFDKNLDFQVAEGLPAHLKAVRLDVATQDPTMGKLVQQLKFQNPEVQRILMDWDASVQQAVTNQAQLITKAAASGEDVAGVTARMEEEFTTAFANKLTELESTLGPDSFRKVSQVLHSQMREVFKAATQSIDTAYGKIPKDLSFAPDAADVLKKAVSSVGDVKAAAGTEALPPAVRKALKLVTAEYAVVKKTPDVAPSFNYMTGKATKEQVGEEGFKGMTVESLKETRSALNNLQSTLEAGTAGYAAIGRLAGSITEVMETKALATGAAATDLLAANALYKSFKEFENLSVMSEFFSVNKTAKVSEFTSEFGARLLTGRGAYDNAPDVLRFANSKVGQAHGLSVEKVQEMVKQAMLAKMRSAVDDVVDPATVRKMVNEHQDVLSAYGLTDYFSNIKDVAGAATRLKLSADDIGNMALSKYGISGNRDKLKTSMATGEFFDELGRVAPKDLAPILHAGTSSLLYDSTGAFRKIDNIQQGLNKYGKRLGISTEHSNNLVAMARLAEAPNGSSADAINAFERYFTAQKPLEEGYKSIALERITRLGLKIVKSLDLTNVNLRDKNAHKQIQEAMFTEAGARKVLALAKVDPDSRLFVHWVLGLSTGAVAGNAQNKENQ